MAEVYLDNAAATPLWPGLLDEYPDLLRRAWVNPAAAHGAAHALRAELEAAQAQFLAALHLPEAGYTVVWTSGATEANNLAVLGTVPRAARTRAVVTTTTEHASVHGPCAVLARAGVPVTWVKVAASGALDLADLRAALTPAVGLVSVCLVQNETGVIQDAAAIHAAVRELAPRSRLHLDAAQALGKIPLPLLTDFDLVTVSGHKIHGPGGVGALIARRTALPEPLFHGGGQQDQRRPGSTDGVGILGCCWAAREILGRQPALFTQTMALRQALGEGLAALRDRQGQVLPLRLVDGVSTSPFICSFSLAGYQGAVLARALSQHGVHVGTGSACAAESKQPSRVLLAMGRSRAEAYGTLRVSFGAQNTPCDVACLLTALQQVLRDY